MPDPQKKAAKLCHEAQLFLEVAARMSVRKDQDRMLEMAQRLIQLARKEDRETG